MNTNRKYLIQIQEQNSFYLFKTMMNKITKEGRNGDINNNIIRKLMSIWKEVLIYFDEIAIIKLTNGSINIKFHEVEPKVVTIYSTPQNIITKRQEGVYANIGHRYKTPTKYLVSKAFNNIQSMCTMTSLREETWTIRNVIL